MRGRGNRIHLTQGGRPSADISATGVVAGIADEALGIRSRSVFDSSSWDESGRPVTSSLALLSVGATSETCAEGLFALYRPRRLQGRQRISVVQILQGFVRRRGLVERVGVIRWSQGVTRRLVLVHPDTLPKNKTFIGAVLRKASALTGFVVRDGL